MRESLTRSVALPDEAATDDLGRQIAAALPDDAAGLVILLSGELGAGKSTLARAIIRALGHSGAVPSPTYTLIEPYELGSRLIYHVDLYRISSEGELEFLGWSDLADGVRIIEWPERVPGLAHLADLRVRLDYEGAGRRADLTGLSDRGTELLARIGLN